MKTQRPEPKTTAIVARAIKNGGYPNVAAEASGISRETFAAWMNRGSRPRSKPAYRDFYQAITKAIAQARLTAEMKAHEEDPKFWLKAGPGRENPSNPGWAATVRPAFTNPTTQAINLFTSPDFLAFMSTLRGILSSHPEALEAVSKALDGHANTLPAIEATPIKEPEHDTD